MLKQSGQNRLQKKLKINENEINNSEIKLEHTIPEDNSLTHVFRQISSEETNYSLKSDINTYTRYQLISSDNNRIILKKIKSIPVL